MARNDKKWTNERHVHFLNTMEASFVKSMLENNNAHFQPLDRYLPDSAESTRDLGNNGRRTTHNLRMSDNVESSERTEKKKRILSCQKSSEDQVVPQFESKR